MGDGSDMLRLLSDMWVYYADGLMVASHGPKLRHWRHSSCLYRGCYLTLWHMVALYGLNDWTHHGTWLPLCQHSCRWTSDSRGLSVSCGKAWILSPGRYCTWLQLSGPRTLALLLRILDYVVMVTLHMLITLMVMLIASSWLPHYVVLSLYSE